MTQYSIRCLHCGEIHGPFSLNCRMGHDALLATDYPSVQLEPTDLPGIWRYKNWLPVSGIIEGSGRTVTYKSEAFASQLGLNDLWIAFNGYWPRRNAFLMTCTFKDLESFPTMQCLKEQNDDRIMVVASAGNTARAFAHVCSITGQPLLLMVPAESVHRLWTILPNRPSVCLVTVDGDYTDTITLAGKIASGIGFVNEGGARNVARRDGMATVMLDAVLSSGSLPDHYFQAVGSGTGGISAWEASKRLIDDTRFGSKLPRLHLAQNLPCAPLYSLWHGTDTFASSCPQGMYDDVLFNRKAPYTIQGGVRDALVATRGTMYAMSNEEASRARSLFEEKEEIDIDPAAAVAIAALIKAVEEGSVSADERIVLNITGGGQKKLRQDMPVWPIIPDLHVSGKDKDAEAEIIATVHKRFGV